MFELVFAFLLIIFTVLWLVFVRLREFNCTFRYLFLGIVLVLFLRPLLGKALLDACPFIFQILIFSLTYFFILHKTLHQHEIIFVKNLDKAFLFFIFALVLSLLNSVEKEISLNLSIYFLSLYSWYVMIINLPPNHKLRRILLNTLILSCLLVMFYGLYQYKFGFPAMREFAKENPQLFLNSEAFKRRFYSNVVFSTFLYAPALAGYLCIIFFTSLGINLSLEKETKQKRIFCLKKLFFYLYFLMMILVLVLTKSKGGWLVFACGLMVFVGLSKLKKEMLKKTIIFLFAFIVFFSLINISGKIVMPKLQNLFASYQVRLDYWKAAWQMIQERPFFGFGPGTFGSVYPYFKIKGSEETQMAHNSFLQIWAELGLFGFLSFLCFWIYFIIFGYQAIKTAEKKLRFMQLGLYVSVIIFLLHNLVDFDLYLDQISTIVFTIIGIFFLFDNEKTPFLRKKIMLSSEKKIIVLLFSSVLYIFLIAYLGCAILAENYDQKAKTAFSCKDFNKATTLLKKAVLLNNLSSSYRFHQAVVFETLTFNPLKIEGAKDYYFSEAISFYKQASQLNPYLPYYHFRLGQLLFLSQNTNYFKEAEFELKKASALYPTNPFYHEQLSKFYDIIGKSDLAKKEKETATRLKKFLRP